MDVVSISFGGLDIAGAEFTLSRGVTPSCCTLYIKPQSALTAFRGPLTFSFGSQSLTFPDMTSDVMHLRKGKHQYWALDLYDRRLYWKNGSVSGVYNERQADGILRNETNAKALADKLFQALGEPNFDTSRMPQNVYPYCNWNASTPAYSLAKLLDYCSCCVAPGQNNNVVVYPLGQGSDLPAGVEGHTSIPLSVPVPNELKVVCGPDLFQNKFKLEAVSVGTDSNIKLIDQTDYKPSAGWGKDFYMFFPAVSSGNRQYAFDSMYRKFRVKQFAQGGMTPPGCAFPVTRIGQYALNNFTCSMTTDPNRVNAEGKLQGRPYMDGTYWPQSDLALNTGNNTRYTGKFSLDSDGIVTTEYPVIKWSTSNAVQEPELYLTTSYSVWKDDYTEKSRLIRSQNLGGTGTVIIRRPDLFRVIKQNYTLTSPTTVDSNAQAIIAQADAYLNLFAQRYSDPNIEDREYFGLLPLLPDGKIAQVKWSLGHTAPTTRASKNFEFDVMNTSEAERRRREQVAQLVEAL